MLHLNGALLYASRPGSGAIEFDSTGLRQDAVAAFAARCSMSIPGFFIPERVDGRRVYDGGLRNNFPVTAFRSRHPEKPFIALYLTNRPTKHKRWLGSELLDIVIDGEEREVVDKHLDDVVVIDPSPIGTVDFRLSAIEKEFLLKVGRAAALRFLQRRQLDEGPNDAVVEQAEREAEKCRADVVRLRKQRRLRRLLWVVAVSVAIIGIGLWLR
jgi:predicted acylesterase/phospholipase RssA